MALAAEVANAYANYRLCEFQVELARASAADGAANLLQKQAQCEINIKGLVSLTALDESALRARLARPAGVPPKLPKPARFAVDAVPARVLAQRPDIAAAERELAAASADIGVAEADRYPRLSLAGNVTPTRSRLDGSPTISVTTWSIGPSLTLPLLDGGRRAANAEAARAQYAAAEAAYRGKVRNAAREVEEAMVRLASVAERMKDATAAAGGYRESLEGARTRQRAGLGSLMELEEARRTRGRPSLPVRLQE